MIIDNNHIKCVTCFPSETNAPLIVHPNTPLPHSITPKSLKPVAGRNAEIFQSYRGIEHHELPKCNAMNIRREARDALSSEQTFGVSVSKGAYHNGAMPIRP